jgi:hypothetical protein
MFGVTYGFFDGESLMSASKRFMNWTNVTWTPAGSGSVAMTATGVAQVQVDTGGSLVKFSGDGDRYNSLLVNDFNEPTMTVQLADLAFVNSLQTGMLGTLSATHNDARNGAGAGAITYNLVGVINKRPLSGGHRQFGQGSFQVDGYSADGSTNPLSLQVAT